ncbi:MAG: kinase-like domain-containing protein [Benjaminiella poitrasii]|nr:MAG: kinase-like domain-containing protein [Benjaminiella poitrasii]
MSTISEINEKNTQKKRELSPPSASDDNTTLSKRSRLDTLFASPTSNDDDDDNNERRQYKFAGLQSPIRENNWIPPVPPNAPLHTNRCTSWFDTNYEYNRFPSEFIRNNNNRPEGSNGVFYDLFGVEYKLEGEEEEEEEDDELDFLNELGEEDDEMKKLSSGIFRRSFYSELMMSSNNPDPKELTLQQSSSIFSSIFDEDMDSPTEGRLEDTIEEEDEEEEEKPKQDNVPKRDNMPMRANILMQDNMPIRTNVLMQDNIPKQKELQQQQEKIQKQANIPKRAKEEEEGTSNFEDKTTLPLSRRIYNEESDAFFSSHEIKEDPDQLVLSNSYKMKLLRRRHQRGPPWITDWPHFLTTEFFKTYRPEDETIPDDEKETRQPIPEGAMFTHYFDAKFPILGKLDVGQFSVVWKARCPITNELCAVKKLNSVFSSWEDRWQHLIEVRNLQKIKGSRHCVELINAWEERGFLFLQFELCSGGSLERYMKFKKRKIDERTVWHIFYEILLGVKDIHKADIAHLDLKPSNILIAQDGCIKITDFGISVQVPANMKWVKGEGDRRYMAPDLLRENFDKPADIFSLGLILLELATGIVLPDTDETWELLRIGDFSKYNRVLSRVSLEMSEMIEWLLTTESEERPTVQDILNHPSFVEVDKRQRRNKSHVLAPYLDDLARREVEKEAAREAELLKQFERGEYGLSTPVDRIF